MSCHTRTGGFAFFILYLLSFSFDVQDAPWDYKLKTKESFLFHGTMGRDLEYVILLHEWASSIVAPLHMA